MSAIHRIGTGAGLFAAALALGGIAPARAAATWPEIALPRDAIMYKIGDQMVVNGLPMRVRGFVSTSPPAALAQWYRRRLRQPLMENLVETKTILGQSHGEYFVSIELEPAGRGTRGMVAVTHLKAAYDNRENTGAAIHRLLDKLPSGTRLLNEVMSQDGAKLSHYLVVSNGYHEDVNRDRVAAMLGEEGLTLERVEQNAAVAFNGKTMFFHGPGKDAIAVIYRNAAGQTVVALNTISIMERVQ